MRRHVISAVNLAVLGFLVGCGTPIPPGAERGPHGTMAYEVLIEASPPGARIEANGESVGNTPLRLKIFGDPDGTFHDFGSFSYVIRALPLATNQFAQIRVFRTGHDWTPEDQIPKSLFFDMNQPTPAYGPPGEPWPAYPGYYGPGYYPGPYYGGPGYYGPSFRVFVGPPHYRRRW